MRHSLPVLLLLAAARLEAGEKTFPLDNFDGSGPRLGMGWQIYVDENALGTKAKDFAVEKDGSPKGLKGHGRFSGHMGKSKAPWPWAVVDLAFNDDGPKDLSAFKSLRFWAKGDGKKHRVRIGRTAVEDYAHFDFTFAAPKEWTLITAPLSEFKQPPWGKAVPRAWNDVTMVGFAALAPGDDEDFELRFSALEFTTELPAKGK